MRSGEERMRTFFLISAARAAATLAALRGPGAALCGQASGELTIDDLFHYPKL